MKKLIVWLGAVAIAVSVQAGSYSQDFNAAAHDSRDLGDDSVIRHSGEDITRVYDTGTYKALLMTQESLGGTVGQYILPDLDAGGSVVSFTATYQMMIKKLSGTAADGYSFNFGAIPSAVGGGEDGMYDSGAGPMLSVGWDTFTDTGIDIFVNGVSVAHSATAPTIFSEDNIGNFENVTITYADDLLDVSYAGSLIFDDVDVSGFTASAGDQFAFAARTGGADENLWIDNLNVTTVPEPATAGLLGISGLILFGIRRLKKTYGFK